MNAQHNLSPEILAKLREFLQQRTIIQKADLERDKWKAVAEHLAFAHSPEPQYDHEGVRITPESALAEFQQLKDKHKGS